MGLDALLGALDAALRGGERAPGEASDLLELLALHEPERPGDPIRGGQGGQGAIEEGELGSLLRARALDRQLGQRAGVVGLVEAEQPQQAPLAERVVRAPDRDLHQPGAERAGVPESVERGVGARERVLGQVRRLLAVSDQSSEAAEDRADVAAEEGVLGPRVAAERAAHELLVALLDALERGRGGGGVHRARP